MVSASTYTVVIVLFNLTTKSEVTVYFALLYTGQGTWSVPAPVSGDQAPARGYFNFTAMNADVTEGVAGYIVFQLGTQAPLLQVNFQGNNTQQTANLTSPNASAPQVNLSNKPAIQSLASAAFAAATNSPQVYVIGNYTSNLTTNINASSLTLTISISDEQTSPTLVAAIKEAAKAGRSFDFIQGLVLPDFKMPEVDPDTLD
jgi:hypothetical protein